MHLKTGDVASAEPDRIRVEVTPDEMAAYVTLNVDSNEFTPEGKGKLLEEILERLKDEGVVFGIDREAMLSQLKNHERILAASGLPPVDGKDSVVRMYQLREPRPRVTSNGNVDLYELDLINHVEKGEWLGERIDAVPGIDGKTVRGTIIPCYKGQTLPLIYDKSSVVEVYQNGVTTLYALHKGAVNYEGDRICVSNHLEIGGDVSYQTGNIDFDGYLTVKGSVDDNFSVRCDKDIEITGAYGVGAVREIESRQGSIYIRGGIAGRNKAVIRAKKDIYTKFVSDATLICEGTAHIGYYCLNSNIRAKEVIVDSPKGQIIGGSIYAEGKVISSIIGSPAETRTSITVGGFDREKLQQELKEIEEEINRIRYLIAVKKKEQMYLSKEFDNSREMYEKYGSISSDYYVLREKLDVLEKQLKTINSFLKCHGEGEVVALKRIFPNTSIQIKNMRKEIKTPGLRTVFYYQDGAIKEI